MTSAIVVLTLLLLLLWNCRSLRTTNVTTFEEALLRGREPKCCFVPRQCCENETDRTVFVITVRLVNLKRKAYTQDLGVDGKIILEWNLGTRVGWCGLDSSGS
jgi:hypothetical protein